MRERLYCPADTRGEIGACHFCIYIPGGASELCVVKVTQYRAREADAQKAAAALSITTQEKKDA